jgi:hypothetical protein
VIKSKLTPCTDWAQKLSARHPDDLKPSDYLALNEHLACCQACTEVYAAYQMMEIGIRSLIVNSPAIARSFRQSQFAKKESLKSRISLPDPITLILSVFSSLFLMISWSSVFQMVYTMVLTVLAHFPQKIAYFSSNSCYTYAIRSDSGFIVWQQKRYRQHSLCSTPIRWSGIGFIGVGISYVSALDFCRYTASA